MKCLTVLVVFGLGCHAQTPDTWELKTYDAPAEVAPELVVALQNLFSVGKDAAKTGQATLAPNHQILVTAPAAYLPGIDALVTAAISKKRLPPASIQLTYWAVIGRPANEGKTPPELQPIAATLEAISKNQGGLQFTPLEVVSLRALSGHSARAEGSELRISQTAAERDGTVVADLEIVRQPARDGPHGKIATEVKIQPGQSIVLGQSGYEDKAPASVFYIVRAEVEAH